MERKRIEELIAIQINGSPAQISSKNRNVMGFTVVEVHLLVRILVETDTDIGRCGRYQRERLTAQGR